MKEKLARLARRVGLRPQQMVALSKAEREFAKRSAQELAGWRREWGEEADKRLVAAQRAATSLGLVPTQVEKIERAIGTRAMLNMFADIGKAL